MVIGIDASRAFTKERTGTENYSWQLIQALARIECDHKFVLYTRGSASMSFLEEESFVGHVPNSSSYVSSTDHEGILRNQRGAHEKKLYSWSVSTPSSYRAQFTSPLQFADRPVRWPFLWTQGGLALETWLRAPDLLFIPAHVIPFLKNPKVPTVVTVHDLGFEFLPWHESRIQRLYLGRVVERLRASLANHIIAVSQATKRDLVNKLGVPARKISVIYEGVDHQRFAREARSQKPKIEYIKAKYGIGGDYFLFVGTIQPRKNLVRLIEAFAKTVNQYDPKVNLVERPNLVIAGKYGWSVEDVYELPEKLGVAERVKFLDYVSDEDLPWLYAGAICFCFPSLHEGFGLPVLEAMAVGTPVVISRSSSLPELAGNAALYVDPLNVDDLARKLRLIVEDPRLREDLRLRGFRRVLKFSWERCAKQTLQVFETLE